MTPEEPDPIIEHTAEALADDEALDWEALRAANPGAADQIEALRALDALAAEHRDARAGLTRSQLASLDMASSAERATALETVPPVFTWGFLRALDRLGEGSFGEVWRAYDPTLHREVALKLRRLPPEQAALSNVAATMDTRARSWLGEARRLASVRHPHVLTVFGAAVHDGRAGLWTELVRGSTLEDRLGRDGPLEPRELASIGVDLCAALAAVHDAGLVHGDVKPANVMLEPVTAGGRPRVVLMDFGAAHEMSQGERAAAMTAGTPLLMAPELFDGAEASAASDLYAAGVVLYRLVSGRWPVEARTVEELRAKHRERGAQPARLPLGVATRALTRLLERALDPDPAKRPASAEAMRRELLAIAAPGRAWVPRFAAAIGAAMTIAAIAWWVDWRPSADRFISPGQLPGPLLRPGFEIADTLVGEPGDQLGWESTSVGDMNGDGCDDIVLGRVRATRTAFQQGSIELRLGSRTGRFGPAVWTLLGHDRVALLPRALASYPDVNGDGKRELLVTQLDFDAPEHRTRGMVDLYLSHGAGFDSNAAARIEGGPNDERFGDAGSIADAGDVDGDGRHDLLVAVLQVSGENPGSGRVELYLGRPGGIETRPKWSVSGRDAYSMIGWQIESCGDVNGDGYADIALGVPGGKGDGPRMGRVEFYPGGPDGPPQRPTQVIVGRQRDAEFGYKVVGMGDLDHDGFADLLVGERHSSGREVDAGRVLLYRGGRGGLVEPPVWSGLRCGSGALVGGRVERVGDMTGDGNSEAALGMEAYSPSRSSSVTGLVTLIGFPPNDLSHPVFRHLLPAIPNRGGAEFNTGFGAGIDPAGDFNGDGLADLLIGEPRSRDDRGAVMLVLGRKQALGR